MSIRSFDFRFGPTSCRAEVRGDMPSLADVCPDRSGGALVICDTNTAGLAADFIARETGAVLVRLDAGEAAKGWASVETVLEAAVTAGVGRDGVFIGIGGGVITDLAAFAASVYMRGVGLILVPTTLLAMVDAALGGKTGFDLFGIKNLVGTFRPADLVVMSTPTLGTLPRREWASGLAEALKTAVIGDEALLELLENDRIAIADGPLSCAALLPEIVARCVAVKGRIVEADPTETGTERALLNLGHTYGHALEGVAGLGRLTHGEAVAWGMARACALGVELGLTPPERAGRIARLLDTYGYETAPAHPAAASAAGGAQAAARALVGLMGSDKKKKAGTLRFVVPTENGAALTSVSDNEIIIRTMLGGSR